tara:strand:+ start:332 stop:700 length:369 start_codon:yes stop_codon:yes gene_type:complete
MTGVLVDACGWVALMDSGLNIDAAMRDVVGAPELMLLEGVLEELVELSSGKRGLLLSLLKSRSTMIENPAGLRHTDDMLLDISMKRGWPVLTVDIRLKERLVMSGCSYVEVVSGRMLRLIGP